MSGETTPSGPSAPDPGAYTRAVLTVIALIVAIAAMKAAQAILVPFIVAAFLAVVGARPMQWLQSKGCPSVIAVALVVLAMMVLLGLTGVVIGRSLNSFTGELPLYQERIRVMIDDVGSMLPRLSDRLSARDLLEAYDPSAAMGLVARMLTGLQKVFANAFLIVLTLIFILLEASTFPVKVRRILSDSGRAMKAFEEFADNLNRYLVIKSIVSFVTGVVLAGWLGILGVDFAVMWGFLAFLLNFIPTIGSILAAVPPVLLATLQFGAGRAALVGIGYLVVNVAIGSILEPRILGRGLGLSTLVIFMSLVIWGWIFGAVGMLIAVPLTMTMKIALESVDRSAWLAVMLGTGKEGPA